MSEELSVEATGETARDAKWNAMRELERLAPRLDPATRALPGHLGGRARPARRRRPRPPACSPRRRRPPTMRRSAQPAKTRSELAGRVRERGRARRPPRWGVRCRVDVRRGRRLDRGDVHGRRARPADRQAWPDDRRGADARQRDRERRRRRAAEASRSMLPATATAAGGRSRQRRCEPPTRPCARAPAVELEPMSAAERKLVHQFLEGV